MHIYIHIGSTWFWIEGVRCKGWEFWLRVLGLGFGFKVCVFVVLETEFRALLVAWRAIIIIIVMYHHVPSS